MKSRPSHLNSNIGKIKYFIPGRKSSVQNRSTLNNSKQNKQNFDKDQSMYKRNSKQLLNEIPQYKTSFLKLQSKIKTQDKHQVYFTQQNDNTSDLQKHQRKISSLTHQKEDSELDFGVLGIKDAGNEKYGSQTLEKEGVYQMLTDESERQNFFEFLEGLKNDTAYQNSITMFTLMYYYQQKKKQSLQAGM